MKLASLSLCAGALYAVSAASAFASTAYVASTVNLRSGPGTSNEIVAKIPAGSRIDASNCKDGWCEVSWQGKTGYAIQTALNLSGRAPSRPRTVYGPGPGPGYYVEGPPPVYYGAPYYYGPRYYYGPPYPYYGPYYRRRWWY